MMTIRQSPVLHGVRRVESLYSTHFWKITCALLLLNLGACIFVIRRVPYTEIDWIAYMEEVSGVINDGQLDYKLLRGGTGPLVYPAGFVYIYSLLYAVTDGGMDIRRAQYIFAALHTVTLALVLCIYRACHREGSGDRFPLWTLGFLFVSRRVMSLFVLRLFNDGVQMMLMYAAILLFVCNRWTMGCLVYSMSVSIKMNGLLFAPGLAVLLCQACGTFGFMRRIVGVCLPVQLILGAPFLLYHPGSYLSRAFELTRKFFYKWSVNGAFLSEPAFLDDRLAVGLLVAHFSALLLFGHFRWTSKLGGGLFGLVHLDGFNLNSFAQRFVSDDMKKELLPNHIVNVLFASNFIGVAFARTLHYQFYLWYAHTVPFLVWGGSLPVALRVTLIITVEAVFNVYPPRSSAAIALSVSHMIILGSLWSQRRVIASTIFKSRKLEDKDT